MPSGFDKTNSLKAASHLAFAPDQLEVVAALFVAAGQLAMGLGALIGGVVVDHFGVQMAMGVGVAGTLGATLWIVVSFPK